MPSLTTGLHPDQPDELPEYRTISALAVVGLVVALFSPLVLIRGMLLIIPLAAGVLCLAALTRIRRSEGRLLGKIPALIGLGLACFFAAAVPAQVITWRSAINTRAASIGLAWLEMLQTESPHKAHQLTKPDLTRRSLTDGLWTFYQSDQAARRELEDFVRQPLIRFLLTLGEDAVIRFYEPASIEQISTNTHYVTQHFAVTYDDPDSGRTSFFVAVVLERRAPGELVGEQWRVADFTGGVRPSRFQF